MANNLFSTFGVDASRVADKLYIGSYNPDDELYRKIGFQHVVRVAKELPKSDFYLDDGPLDAYNLAQAFMAAENVSAALRAGQRTIVTCHLGMNRSALVAGMAMKRVYGMPGPDVVSQIRFCRSKDALGNPAFADYLTRGSSVVVGNHP
jgi:protein-tyrosine phosphatase